MVNFDQSIKKLVCPLCEGLFPCYSSLRKHVLKDHEPNQNQVLCRFGNCRMKFKDRADASTHLIRAHNSARDDKYLKTLPLHLGDFFKARCADEGAVAAIATDGWAGDAGEERAGAPDRLVEASFSIGENAEDSFRGELKFIA